MFQQETTIPRAGLASWLHNTSGRFFTVTFQKKDKSWRRMTARLGVKKGVTGKGMAYNPGPRGLLPAWDSKELAFRMINLNTTTKVTFQKRDYAVV